MHYLAIALTTLLVFAPDPVLRGRAAAPGPVAAEMAHALLFAPGRHVRAYSPLLQRIMESGMRRSPTFGHLVASLEHSDVIVQIVEDVNLPLRTPARVVMVPNPNTVRFIRIQVRPEGTEDDLVTIIGHELRHAIEIAADPTVRDDHALAALYRRIGFAGPTLGDFDTEEAHAVGRRVRRELRDPLLEGPRAALPSRD